MIGTSDQISNHDQSCWLAEACKILLLASFDVLQDLVNTTCLHVATFDI